MKFRYFRFSKFSIFGACPEGMATFILIIYQNYIIPNLREYILKISLKSVDKRLTKPDRFHEKSVKTFFTQKLAQYRKIKDIVSHSIFQTDLEKQIEPKKQQQKIGKK